MLNQNSKGFLTLAAGISALFASSAAVQAAPTYYIGTNGTATSNANLGGALTARNNFFSNLSTLGTVTTFTFENYAGPAVIPAAGVTTPQFNVKLTSPGNTATGTVNSAPSSPAQGVGFNTTTGGSKYLTVAQTPNNSATLTFTFVKPVDAFGFYVTGLGNSGGSLLATFNDGTVQTNTVTGVPGTGGAGGGAEFFGFTDAGKSIASLTFFENAVPGNTIDRFSIDDITTVVVPEPAQSATLLLGFLGLIAAGVLRKNRRQTLAS